MTSKREKILTGFTLSLIIILLVTILVWIENNKIMEFTPTVIAMAFGYAVFLVVWGGISLIDEIRKR